MGEDWREDDDSRVTRALAAMNERVEELECRCSMLEDEIGFQLFEGMGGNDEDDEDALEDDHLDEDLGLYPLPSCHNEDDEEVDFLGDIDDDEEGANGIDLEEVKKEIGRNPYQDPAKALGMGGVR